MRINCIPVKYLADQHLRAEWLEILMLPPYLRRSIASKNGLILLEDSNYRLSTGHARFFYDKLLYVEKRYKEIEVEMIARGYNTNPNLDLSSFPKELFNDWIPSEEDMINNLHRILTRIYDKPKWYTWWKKQRVDWKMFYAVTFNFYKYQLRDSDLKK
jgi:deoxyribonuclease (pyrimidine dimer)